MLIRVIKVLIRVVKVFIRVIKEFIRVIKVIDGNTIDDNNDRMR